MIGAFTTTIRAHPIKKQNENKHLKCVDDLTVAESIDIKEKLETYKKTPLKSQYLSIAELIRYGEKKSKSGTNTYQ